MASRSPLVIGSSGLVEQLQSGDQLSAPITNETVWMATNGESGSITQGMPVYISAADTVKKAKGDVIGTSKVLGLVSDASISTSASGEILIEGVLSMSDWTTIIGSATLTANSYYWLSDATAGNLTATAPNTVGHTNVLVGLALSTTEMLLTIHPYIKL